MQKLQWQQPSVEVLDVAMTLGGPKKPVPDKNLKGGNNRKIDTPPVRS
ncbi:paeninodin family lasso peptide [Gorillibacterium massiliense]|nr:paeninodin family lasso peptide [Gorillibacterium massiliense]